MASHPPAQMPISKPAFSYFTGWRADCSAFLLYTAFALVSTWPLPLSAAGSIMGDGADGWQETWEMWWFNRALGMGATPYHFATLYAPGGATNYLHSLNPIEIVLTLPVQWAFGVFAAYNVACWMALALTAFGGYLLGRDVTGSRLAGFLSGLALGFAPHQFAQLLGHMDVASIQFFVLGVWCLYRSFGSSGKRALTWTLWSAACLAASALSHPYSLIYCLITFPLMGISWSIRGLMQKAVSRRQKAVVGRLPSAFCLLLTLHRREHWRPAINALISIVIGMLVVSPLLLAMGGQLTGPDAPRRRDIPAEVDAERQIFSADLAAYVLPSPFNPLWGAASKQAMEPVTGGISEKVVFPGYVVIALALVGIFSRATRRRAFFWALLAGAGFLLSLGPALRIAGATTLSPMPASLFYLLPGSFTVRVPARFNVLLLLGLCICAALGVQALARSRFFARAPRTLHALALLLICLELLPIPYPSANYNVERWFDKVAGVDRQAAVLEVPFSPGDVRPEMWQIASGMPLAGGYLSRQPVDPLSGGAPPFAELGLNRAPSLPPYNRTSDTLCRPPPQEQDYLDVMRLAGVRYVALHLDTLAPDDPRITMAARLFPSPPVYSAPTLTVYDTGGGDAPSGLLGIAEDVEDWFPVEGNAARWAFSKPARIHVWSGTERPVRLSFKLASFPAERAVSIIVDGRVLESEQVDANGHVFSLEWVARRGFSTLTISPGGPAVTPASLGVGSDTRPLTVQLSQCHFSASP